MTELEASLRRCVADLRALQCRFARVGGLAVSALAEPRLTRDADLASLAAVARASDWESAQRAVGLITERGFAQGRDLVAALDELRSVGAY